MSNVWSLAPPHSWSVALRLAVLLAVALAAGWGARLCFGAAAF